MASSFVNVDVEEHDALPEGCCLRFRAQAEGQPVERITYESETGTAGTWRVEAQAADGSTAPARAYPVDDSSAGTSMLIVGGAHGLRLTSLVTGETLAEAYLLLSLGCVVA